MNINSHFIIEEILKYSPSHLIIGYSGGIDSSVLLDIAYHSKISVTAIYINHAINSNADNWEKHCKDKCNDLNIKFISYRLEQVPKGESFEAWASKQRMSFFKTEMVKHPNPLLLLGHHQDDQAETFLLQAIRGAGLAGLASIPRYKKLKVGAVIRPLLKHSKAEIINYAKLHNISYVYDDSNEDNKYRRNLIRNKVLPTLQGVTPNIAKTLSRSANICAKSNYVLNILLDKELNNISIKNDILLDKFINLEKTLQQSILHLWFKNITKISLKDNQITDISYSLNNSAPSTGWQININKKYSIVLAYNLLKISNNNANITTKVNQEAIFEWLKKQLDKSLDIDNIIIRDRLGSDRCRYIGRNKTTKLKVLFQELKIPQHERKNIKIIELNQQIIAVYPFFICDVK